MGKQIIEVKGVKMEVDLREAKTIDTYRVGDLVKILVKAYSNEFKVKAYAGVIIGFDAFVKLPTIVVAYLKLDYSGASVVIESVNNESACEITHANEGDVPFSKKQVLDLLDRDVDVKRKALDEANWHRTQFLDWFGKYFAEAAEKAGVAAE